MAASKKKAPTKKAAKKRLTPRREKFADVFEGNATQAAIEAGFSPKTARQAGHRLLTNVDIRERIERRKAEAMRRARIETDVVVGSLAEIATASLADVNPDDEFLRRAKALGTDHLIKKVKVNYDRKGAVTSREYEMYSRMEALNQLCTVLGLNKKEAENPQTAAKAALRAILSETGLSEERARQIVAERFNVPESDLISEELM